MVYSTSLSSGLPLPLLCFMTVSVGIKDTLIMHRKAYAYIPGVTFKSVKHWSTGINQKSIKLLSNLKQSHFTVLCNLSPCVYTYDYKQFIIHDLVIAYLKISNCVTKASCCIKLDIVIKNV